MRIPIVNKQDEIIGYRDKTTLADEDIYRVSCLWITDEEGRILLAQRVFTKKHHPGKWGPAVAGTVEEGETYESNIIKEAEEEIGLTGYTFTTDEKYYEEGIYKHFTQQFSLTLPVGFNQFKIQEDEVAQIKWFTKEELKRLIAENPDQFLKVIVRLFG